MRLFLLATFTMCLFAANSLLCRLALARTGMDATSFTILRLVSGMALLWAATSFRRGPKTGTGGSFPAAAALFVYMWGFSLAYRGLTAATGTLVMAVAIFVTALAGSRLLGEPLGPRRLAGAGLSLGGLAFLLAPSLTRPPLTDSMLMGCAGVAWSVYSILGRKNRDATQDTAGNFLRALPLALALLPFARGVSWEGACWAVTSGAVCSGLGYVLWYRLVAALSTLSAALVQLGMPVLTALGAWALLGEPLTLRLLASGGVILFGIGVAQYHAHGEGRGGR